MVQKLRVTFEHPALGGYFHIWMTPGSLRLNQEWNRHNPDEWLLKNVFETEYATEYQGLLMYNLLFIYKK